MEQVKSSDYAILDFGSNNSNIYALTDVFKHIYKLFDEGNHAYKLLSFDTVDHKILLKKLEHYGIRGTELSWLTLYLSTRKQFTCINNTSLQFTNANRYSVLQGSALGPIPFLLFINDIHAALKHGIMKLFADDTNFFITGKDFI